jgi:hypothetical protein
LGTNIASYRTSYELRSDNSTNAWDRLIHVIDVLNNTPTNQLADRVQDVLGVDSWLWFLAVENVFADDDSYWNKGADYGFYFEPESGRVHPVEHDGNEAFIAADASLSPVQGTTGTNRPVIRRLLGVPELRQRYLAHMRTVLEESFHPSIMTVKIGALQALSAADVAVDPKKSFTMTGYTNAVRDLRTFVTNRYRFLTNHAELRPVAPTILEVSVPSPAPMPSETPIITARMDTNPVVGSVWLHWRDRSYGRFQTVEMLDDGAHGDGAAGDGVFGAGTTNHPAGTRVRYYVEARAAAAPFAARFAPTRAERVTFSYRVRTGAATDSPVVINELMASNTRTLADPQGQFDDWIELRNLTSEPVDLSGWFLSDNPEAPRKWQFPAGTVIPASGYLLVWADENGGDSPGLHASFKLAAAGETLLLIDSDARQNALLDQVAFGRQQSDRSHGRRASDPQLFGDMAPTPGQPNN